jgi:hypothetical protein
MKKARKSGAEIEVFSGMKLHKIKVWSQSEMYLREIKN